MAVDPEVTVTSWVRLVKPIAVAVMLSLPAGTLEIVYLPLPSAAVEPPG